MPNYEPSEWSYITKELAVQSSDRYSGNSHVHCRELVIDQSHWSSCGLDSHRSRGRSWLLGHDEQSSLTSGKPFPNNHASSSSLIRLSGLTDWLSMVLRLHRHNIGYTADGFYRSMTQPTVSKHWRRVVRWLVIQTGLSLTRLTSLCYNNITCMEI